jgi:uncharacterized protein (DUF433 family)
VEDDELIAKWIEQREDKPGLDEAWIKDYWVSVWAIAGYSRFVPDLDEIAADYALPREAVDAAMAYYRRYKHIFDARFEALEAAEV